ncbi:MAG: hypothetical protein PHX25_02895 [Candidatus Pacebacteria bacterium]|nr:hypothetical protein [Candidatus Paceibacterota bacterium]
MAKQATKSFKFSNGGHSCITPIDPDPYHCKKCWSSPKDHKIVNYEHLSGIGDIQCTICKSFVRVYES